MPHLETLLRVGLLGGSFNPAHQGHLHISRLALERLGLDEVWWLVSPQNPLKPTAGMAPHTQRMAQARTIANHARIKVTDIELVVGTRYTVDTVAALKAHFPGHKFVWLMGADILIEMDRWKNWRRLLRSLPIAIFVRPTYSFKALRSRAARRFGHRRVPARLARRLADMRPPAWVFLNTPTDPISATKIREARAAVAHVVDQSAPQKLW